MSVFEPAGEEFMEPVVERFAGVLIEPFAPLMPFAPFVPLVIREPGLFLAPLPAEGLIPAPLRIGVDPLTPEELGVMEPRFDEPLIEPVPLVAFVASVGVPVPLLPALDPLWAVATPQASASTEIEAAAHLI